MRQLPIFISVLFAYTSGHLGSPREYEIPKVFASHGHYYKASSSQVRGNVKLQNRSQSRPFLVTAWVTLIVVKVRLQYVALPMIFMTYTAH